LPSWPLVRQAGGLGLDRDAAFAFDVHLVEVLLTHVARIDQFRDLQHPVRKRGLAVVDVRHDAEVADAVDRVHADLPGGVGRRRTASVPVARARIGCRVVATTGTIAQPCRPVAARSTSGAAPLHAVSALTPTSPDLPRHAVANIKSQIKRNRQNEAARVRNKTVRTRLKTRLRQFRDAAEAGDRDAAESAYHVAARELDKAATKGVIHANNAANKKSRMAKRLAAL
jgi:small subunit ribosomal protein S20